MITEMIDTDWEKKKKEVKRSTVRIVKVTRGLDEMRSHDPRIDGYDTEPARNHRAVA